MHLRFQRALSVLSQAMNHSCNVHILQIHMHITYICVVYVCTQQITLPKKLRSA